MGSWCQGASQKQGICGSQRKGLTQDQQKRLDGILDTKGDAFSAMESVMSWEDFVKSVDEAEKLARFGEFDSLALVLDRCPQIRRYASQFLDAFEFRALPASEDLLKAIRLIRELNTSRTRKVPEDASRTFVRKRWERHVFGAEGIDRQFYETCVLAKLGKRLGAGDLWVAVSRRYRDFEEYVLTPEAFAAVRSSGLPLAIELDGPKYLAKRTDPLHAELQRVDSLAMANQLPEASITDGVLKISPLDNQESDTAETLTRQASSLLPRVKITDLLSDVDDWCNFGRHFTHL